MPQFTDQTGNTIHLDLPPQRIISLVPSQTELLFELGLEKEVIGITKFCIHPRQWFRNKIRIGGTKQIDIEKIKSLEPNLVIANKEENEKAQVENIAKTFPVWVSDIQNLTQALEMIGMIGKICDKETKASELIRKILDGFEPLEKPNHKTDRQDCCYLIWKDPYMTVGGDCFINDMLERAGFNNVFKHLQRYPEIQVEELVHCPLIFLSSEPYPFGDKHIHELKIKLPHTRIELVDGELFSWYGSRLMHAPSYFTELKNRIGAIS
ncbi:MAG: ABC transporter substrate-binding protein [Flavisolibacter sp.]|nr:ABC transporter substrate-binding protein [Flavisolibacter sp.]